MIIGVVTFSMKLLIILASDKFTQLGVLLFYFEKYWIEFKVE